MLLALFTVLAFAAPPPSTEVPKGMRMITLDADVKAVPGELVDLKLGECTLPDVLVKAVWTEQTRHTAATDDTPSQVDVVVGFYDIHQMMPALASKTLAVTNPHAGVDPARTVDPPRCEVKP